jgi:ureidoglycolate hydrolase
MQNSAPSDQQQQVETNNGQVEKTLDASSSETQARVSPSVTSIPSATPKQILAIKQFYEFNKHLSIKMYAVVMKSHFSSEHARSIKEFLEAMGALGPLTSETAMRVLELPFCKFFH